MPEKAWRYLRITRQRIVELFLPGSAQNRKAQEMVEYALLAGFVAVTVAATVPFSVTTPLSTIFSKIKVHLVTHGG